MKKKLLYISLCSILILTSTGCGKKIELKDGKEVVASVKKKKFTAEDLFDELKDEYGYDVLMDMIDTYISNTEIKDNEESDEYAKNQVDSLKSQYEASGYDFDQILTNYGYSSRDELEKSYAKNYKKELVAKKYIKENKVTDDAIEQYYKDEIYGTYTVKHILISPETTDDMSDEEVKKAEEKALKEAENVIKKLNESDKVDDVWPELVKKYSDDSGSVKDEGLISDFTKGDVVDEFFDATVALKKGEYTKTPVKSTYGYHIILKVKETDKPSLKDSKEEIINNLVDNYIGNDSSLIDSVWTELREKYNLKINDTDLNKEYQSSDK